MIRMPSAAMVLCFIVGMSANGQETSDLRLSKGPDTALEPTSYQQKVLADKSAADRSAVFPLVRGTVTATGTELIQDGGFESGGAADSYGFSYISSAWSWYPSGSGGTSKPRYTSPSNNASHSGLWCVYFDFGPAQDQLYQMVTIPANSTATLSFWLKIGGVSPNPSDVIGVNFADKSGAAINTFVRNYHASDAVGFSYVHYSYDVSALAGQTVYLLFWTHSYGNTIFLLDDVSLIATPSGTTPPSISSFVASPSTVSSGQSSTLTWSSSNGTTASIDNGIGTVPTSGTMTVRPYQTTIYALTVSGTGGTATAYATVAVNSNGGGGGGGGTCTAGGGTLCLQGRRFKATATYQDYSGTTFNATGVSFSDESGYFWFGSATNVEVFLKVLNSCATNGKYSVYAAGATDLGVSMTVTDTTSGVAKTYNNRLGTDFVLVKDAPFACQ